MDRLIQTKQTGTPSDFAQKMSISKSMLFRYIKFMKDELGCPISYSKSNSRYEYALDGFLSIKGWRSEKREVLRWGDQS